MFRIITIEKIFFIHLQNKKKWAILCVKSY